MGNYIDITESIVFSGVLGLLAPFIFPYIYKLFTKIAKREATKEEKRLIISFVSLLIAIGLAAYDFDWTGDIRNRIYEFVVGLFSGFAIFKGAVQAVYELIIKNFPELDKRLEEVSK